MTIGYNPIRAAAGVVPLPARPHLHAVLAAALAARPVVRLAVRPVEEVRARAVGPGVLGRGAAAARLGLYPIVTLEKQLPNMIL